ncbi:MAG: tetratricopeptide repeat protein [Bacteroidota bacterium]
MRLTLFILLLLAGPAWAQPANPSSDSLGPGGWIASELTDQSPTLRDSSHFEVYTVLSDGEPFEVRMYATTFDTYLILRSPSGQQYDNDDAEGSWYESRVEIGPERVEVGEWGIVATTYTAGDTGPFVVAHRSVGTEINSRTLDPGGWAGAALTPTDSVLRDSSYADLYTLPSDGQPFEIRLLSNGFDPYVTLRSPSGELIWNDDYDGSQRESRVVVAAPEVGEWTVFANSYAAGETGEYALTHRQLDAAEAEAYMQASTEQVRDTTLARAASLSGQAVVLYNEGRYSEGLPMATEALALQRATLGESHPDVAHSLLTLGLLIQASGDAPTARDTLTRAVGVMEAAYGPESPVLAPFVNAQAQMAYQSGDLGAAAVHFERTLDLLGAGQTYRLSPDRLTAPDLGDHAQNVAATLYNLARLRAEQDSTAYAEQLYRMTLAIEESTLGPEHPDVAVTLVALGQLRQRARDLEAARAAFDRALQIQETAVTRDGLDLVRTLVAFARLSIDQGDYPEARESYDRALARLEADSRAEHPETASVVNAIGELVQLEAFEKARPLYERALASLEATLGTEHEATIRARNNLTRLESAQEDLRTNAPPARLRGSGIDIELELPTRAGLDRAILFATDVYEDAAFDRLNNPIADAEAVARELHDRYAFDTTIVRNPTRQQIYAVLSEAMEQPVPENSQLVVFFAGHGTLNKGRGFIIPRDARAGDRSSWFSYAALSEELDTVPDHRVLLLLDVCQGGSFLRKYRSSGDEYQRASPQELMAKSAPYRARLAITSGGEEYVSDGAPGNHSPFAYHLLDALRSDGGPDGDGLLVFDELVGYVRAVRYATPLAGGFRSHEPGGTFFFYNADVALGDAPE